MTTRRLAPDAPLRGPDDRGSAAAEFAVVVPVLLLLLFVMVTLASVFFDQLQLQAAARDAARTGAVEISEACDAARSALVGNDVGVLTCTAITTCADGAVRMSLQAVKSYSVPVLGNRSVTLTASSSFTCPRT